jgi:allantoinase
MEMIGAAAKCAPPLRSSEERQGLWEALLGGQIDVVASDHSPAPASIKAGGDFFAVWGGIAGIQSTLAVLLDRGVPVGEIARLTAAFPAKRFGLAGKGAIVPGNDADLAFVDGSDTHTLTENDLHQRHKISPYLGHTFRGRTCRTMLRGQTIFQDGVITSTKPGRFAAPDSTYATSRIHS